MYRVYEFSCPVISSVESGNEDGNRTYFSFVAAA